MVPTDTIPDVVDEPYRLEGGIYVPPTPVLHREDEYASRGFELLAAMQQRHFWYRGRHRFLLHAVRRHLDAVRPPRIIDLGGGCGGWLAYLLGRRPGPVAEVALGDSSGTALRLAARSLPAEVRRYRIDLLSLHWRERWDVAFLLDVLEHLPEEEQALAEIHTALTPGGLLFITTPALRCFWTWNDEVVGHQRRYAKADFRRLAVHGGFDLLDVRYFQFFLSPLLLATRWLSPARNKVLSGAERWQLVERLHRVPGPVVNTLLTSIFAAETPLGHLVPFPWGTSVLAIFRKR